MLRRSVVVAHLSPVLPLFHVLRLCFIFCLFALYYLHSAPPPLSHCSPFPFLRLLRLIRFLVRDGLPLGRPLRLLRNRCTSLAPENGRVILGADIQYESKAVTQRTSRTPSIFHRCKAWGISTHSESQAPLRYSQYRILLSISCSTGQPDGYGQTPTLLPTEQMGPVRAVNKELECEAGVRFQKSRCHSC
jgi:hypothetical protein